MRILAIEPYYDGSHRAFLDGWRNYSQHAWTLLELPGYKWKWRMRHASLTMANRVDQLLTGGDKWDLVFCSDMLNLPEFLGMSSRLSRHPAPLVVYFHENQLTYPSRQPRDYQYAYSNFLTALRADGVWFNSDFHRAEFLRAMLGYLRRMPDFQHLDAVDVIRDKCEVQAPGIDLSQAPDRGTDHPLRILWCARWEHDKNPDDFFLAIRDLEAAGHDFRLAVIGPSYHEVPAVFANAKSEFRGRIDHWGYQPSKDDYRRVLAWADVFVSTANHEFFGLSVTEAISAGVFPLLPHRLAYPEVVGADDHLVEREHLYSGSSADLANRLSKLVIRYESGGLWAGTRAILQSRVGSFAWPQRSSMMDASLVRVRSNWLAAGGSF